jgi:hypothetical protein
MVTIDASSVAGAQATVRFMFVRFLMSQGAFSRVSASGFLLKTLGASPRRPTPCSWTWRYCTTITPSACRAESATWRRTSSASSSGKMSSPQRARSRLGPKSVARSATPCAGWASSSCPSSTGGTGCSSATLKAIQELRQGLVPAIAIARAEQVTVTSPQTRRSAPFGQTRGQAECVALWRRRLTAALSRTGPPPRTHLSMARVRSLSGRGGA